MNQAIMLSIIVGVQHAQKNVAEIVRAVAPALHPQVELLFCHTAADPDVPALVGAQGQIRPISGPTGSLIPHLWRDGILAASGERVATTTAHCIPTQGWVEALIAADLDNAAYGGIIENDPNADAKHRNRYSAREFIAQRFAHGQEFGLARARTQTFLRSLLLILLSPCIFVVLIKRIVSASRRKPELRKQLRGTWIWLALFTLAWTVGETSGYITSLRDRLRRSTM